MTSAASHDAGARAIEHRIKAQAYGLGFDLVGITSAGPAPTSERFERWIAEGRAGEMHYLERGAMKRRDTRLPVEGARSAIVVGINYGGREPRGPVARYARGDDYHDVLESKLRALHRHIDEWLGTPVRGKAYVDTGPVLERDLARRAGLGWFGKNTMLINPSIGSFFFLGVLLLDLDLVADAPFDIERCGSCSRCVEACPTDAIVEPGGVDARRCISYLTIEIKGAIPLEFRESIGDLLYGCDICQDVCPWNMKFSRPLPDDSPYRARPALGGKDTRTLAREILALDDDRFRAAYKGSPMKRAKLRGLKRNAAVTLGNVGSNEDTPLLTDLASDPDPLVAEHATWALHRIRARDQQPGDRS
jgi:epoxyqueuosine reductase